MKVLLKAPYFHLSGYGQVSREISKCLHENDICVRLQASYFGKKGETPEWLQWQNNIDAFDCIINVVTPDNLSLVYSQGYNININFWETDLYPQVWINELNRLMNHVIVFSNYNKLTLQNSGCVIPISVLPYPVDKSEYEDMKPIALHIPEKKPFLFYSISQWSARKNLETLLKAYYLEFANNENVLLVLRTYISYGLVEFDEIVKRINDIKENLNLESYPRVIIIVNELSRQEMLSLHKLCDCYVSAHHSEGIGLPIIEAMASKNPVIVTGYSGNMDYCNDDNSYLINYKTTPVYGQVNKSDWKDLYRGYMNWGDPDIYHLRSLMRKVFSDRKENVKGYETVTKNTHKIVGEFFKQFAFRERVKSELKVVNDKRHD